ncbi:MAG: hypothetical protein M1831_004939 [Alyxoria varia]|nr:MAG: hypothetical protein M1831_004939 [Alyxoria varia]
MEAARPESPLKTWVRKHSPLKSRNKQLPPLPPRDDDHEGDDDLPRKRALSNISGNAHPANSSPHKAQHQASKQTQAPQTSKRTENAHYSHGSENALQQQRIEGSQPAPQPVTQPAPQQKSKRLFSGFLRHRSSDSPRKQQPQRPQTPMTRPTSSTSHTTTARPTSNTPTRKRSASASPTKLDTHRVQKPRSSKKPQSPRRNTNDHSPHGLRHLSQRVTSLESELEAARAELATKGLPMLSSPSKIKHSSPSRRATSAAAATTSAGSVDGNRMNAEVAERQARLERHGRYEGLVEALLQPDYRSASATAASRGGSRSASRNSTERDGAIAAYGAVEQAYAAEQGDDDAERAKKIAKRRSEIRAASWKQIQDHVSQNSNAGSGSGSGTVKVQRTIGAKRARSYDSAGLASSSTMDAQEEDSQPRAARRQKQSHYGDESDGPEARPAVPPKIAAAAPPRQRYYTDAQAEAAGYANSKTRRNTHSHSRQPSMHTIRSLSGGEVSMSPSKDSSEQDESSAKENVGTGILKQSAQPQIQTQTQTQTQTHQRSRSESSKSSIREKPVAHANQFRRMYDQIASSLDKEKSNPPDSHATDPTTSASKDSDKHDAPGERKESASYQQNWSTFPESPNQSHGRDHNQNSALDELDADGFDRSEGSANRWEDGDNENAPPSPQRTRHVPSPSRLHTVNEEFEWDEDIF